MSKIIFIGGPLDGQVQTAHDGHTLGLMFAPLADGKMIEYRESLEFDDQGRSVWRAGAIQGPDLPGIMASRELIRSNATHAVLQENGLWGATVTVQDKSGVELSSWQIGAYGNPQTWEEGRNAVPAALADKAGLKIAGDWEQATDGSDVFRVSVEPDGADA
jgi:hypothetical protein